MQDTRSTTRWGYAALASAILLFSTIEVASKWIGPSVPPLRLAVLRFLAGGLALAPFAAREIRSRKWTRQDLLILAGLALTGVTALSGFYHFAITLMPANQAAILFSGNPVFVAALAPALLGERIGRRERGAMALGVAGTIAFLWGRGHFSLQTAAGVMFMLCAMFFFALYTVLTKKCLPRYGAVPLTCLACIFGSLALVPVSWLREGSPFRAIPLPALLAVAYLALATTALAYVLFFHGLKRVPASRGSLFFFIKPPAAALLAWLVLHEAFTLPMAAGTALILAGTALTLRRAAPVREAAITD